MKKLYVTVGIAAYNEEQNIARLLQSIIDQKLKSIIISEIIVVSSGSSDSTNNIVKTFSARYPLIKLIKETNRRGKASAVNLILQKAKEDIIILSSADIILNDTTVEYLIKSLRKPEIGIVGSRPIPLNDPHTFFGFAAHLLWDLHHAISLRTPKMGECIAFRKVFKQIPVRSSVDETNIESLIHGQGFTAFYEPKAIVYNMGAQNIQEFLARRRHIYAGHLATLHQYKYKVSTINSMNICYLLLKNFKLSWRAVIWTPIIILLEIYGRWLGYLDYTFKRKSHTIWYVTKSTKKLPLDFKFDI
jgi:poly-beta-1,6-N-acetyl-D-glucosamine synthase